MDAVTGTLLILGFGFLVANARLLIDLLRFTRRRKSAILTWLGPPPPYYVLTLSLGVATGVLVALKVWEVLRVPGGLQAVTLTRNQFWTLFGELMMLIEPDKRGPDFAIPLTYSDPDGERFSIPENLYLLGMMNTADRSLAFALDPGHVSDGEGYASRRYGFAHGHEPRPRPCPGRITE